MRGPGLPGRSAVQRALLAAAALALVAACSPARSAPSAPSRGVGTRLNHPVSSSVLSLPFQDSAGRTRHLADFRGKVLVISDVMTLCQETCPLDTADVVQTARQVAKAGLGKHVEFLSITVDPHRDTTHRLAAYRQLFRPPPKDWLTLTGTPAHVHALWRYFGVFWKKVPTSGSAPKDWLTGRPLTYDVEHSDEVFFLDQRSHERFVLEGAPHVTRGSAIPHRLYKFLSSKGHNNVMHPSAAAWTVPQADQVIGWLTGRRISGR
jgi:protein SCO1/2